MGSTPAIRALEQAGHTFQLCRYAYDPAARHIGLHAADALGEPPEHVLKTLLAEVDRAPVCVVVPVSSEVAMKRLAAAQGGKAAHLLPPLQAERLSGYMIGGVSPFGQRRPLPTIIEERALLLDYVFVNGGQRGLQLRIAPGLLLTLPGAIAAPLVA